MIFLNTFLPFKGSYIYNIFMAFNKILFSVLTRNAIPALLLRSGNAVFFIGINFWTNVLLSKTGRNALFVQILFCHSIINAFITWGLLWTKWFILHAKEPVMLNHNDDDRTHKNEVNTLSWHMINVFFWTSASYKQFKSLALESRSSNIVL